jgi:RNA polymerase sigma-70 factor, ECF subfamily
VTRNRTYIDEGDLSPARREWATMDDQELVARARDDNLEALTGLWDKYYVRAVRYCSRLVKTHEDAEDIAAVAIECALLDKLDQYRGGNFASWILRITHNKVADFYRKRSLPRRKDQARERREIPLSVVAAMADPKADSDPEAAAIMRDDHERLALAVSALPERQRIALGMYWFGEHTDVEIAAILDTTPNGARQTRYRAMQELQRQLA